MRDVKNYEVFLKSHEMVLEIYNLTNKFPALERETLGNQLRDSASSIPIALINSNYRKSSVFFDYIRKALEGKERLEYFLLLSKELKILDQNKWEKLYEQLTVISKMLVGIYKRKNGAKSGSDN